MDERWRRELTKLRDAPRPPDDLWDRIGAGSRMPEADAPSGSRAVTIAVALMVAIAALAIAWIAFRPVHGTVPGALGELDVPPPGEVAPANLDDGRPVFVVHRDDGTVEVIDAFSTHVPGGLGKLVAWCPSSRTFTDVYHGSKWNEDGGYYLGPAPTGLVTYETAVQRDGHVVVGPAIAPGSRAAAEHMHLSGPFCQTDESLVLATLPTAVSDSPIGVVAQAPSGWVAVRGKLVWASNGAELCAPNAPKDTCADAAEVVALDPNTFESKPLVVDGTFIARVQDGTLVDLTRAPQLPFKPFF